MLWKVATASGRSRGEDRQLTLWRERIEEPDIFALMRLHVRRPGVTGFPTTAYLLTESDPQDPEKTQLLWAAQLRAGHPWPPSVWSAALVWSPGSPHGYVVLAKSQSFDLEVQVHRIESSNQRSAFPIQWDPDNFENWPKSAPPFSQTEQRFLPGKEVSDFCSISATLHESTLLIQARGHAATTPVLAFSLNLETKAWGPPQYQQPP
jgi:hypothetical protein